MRVEIDAQLRRALDHVVAIYASRECFVLHLFSHAGHLNIGDGLGRLYQRARGQEASQLIAGKKDLSRCVTRGHAGILRMAEDGCAHLHRPAQPLQFADAYKWMLFERRMALVVEVVQQGSGRVELDQAAARFAPVSPSRSASASPQAATQASTASACLRRLSLCVHSVSSCQAWARRIVRCLLELRVICFA